MMEKQKIHPFITKTVNEKNINNHGDNGDEYIDICNIDTNSDDDKDDQSINILKTLKLSLSHLLRK